MRYPVIIQSPDCRDREVAPTTGELFPLCHLRPPPYYLVSRGVIPIANPESLLYYGGMKFEELVEIMGKLRHPEKGCPWDLKQDPKSLKAYLIEETYEVAEAIDQEEPQELCGELGDLLFQILFQARIQQERGNFDIYDVVEAIGTKMKRRHPHIFGDAVAHTPEDVKARWEAIKKEEFSDRESVLDGIPSSLPALLRARRVGKKASNVGFDWPDKSGPIGKIREEITELEEAMEKDDKETIYREFGDLLFSLANIGRHINVNLEDALNDTTNRFIKRFAYIEKALEKSDKKMEDMTLDALDSLWEEAKGEVG